ncbi:hypothetical protein XELAEV_18010482mg [Xenopus laevis]|uniref:Uncharacterized protein n=1 Tax=Xenopus laevis TaxID=8355 RepID=A0A974I214_XENLA|nr:hypothetical protein XELAEV_18010482mg [Xenopus laevis]
MEWRGMQCSPCSLKVLVLSLFPPKYGSIDRSTFKPLGRPCIPVYSIPQTAEAGSTSCLGSNRMECSVHLVA